MNRKNKLIIGLLGIGLLLFCTIQFWIIPTNNARDAEYAKNQTEALTHDIRAIEEYRSAYIGNASNIVGLFENLPLCDISKKYEIDSENCILTVNYLDTVWNIGEEKVQRALIYSSVAAMAAIDNLSDINYSFSGAEYSFTRKQIEEIYGTPLSRLLSQESRNEELRNRLNDINFIGRFFD